MMPSLPKILLLSAYDTPSHRYWRTTLKQLKHYDWTQLALPARYFAWRLRGNSLSWGLGDYPELEQSYDLIIATSMVDISALRGFRPTLASAPLLVYFHENQFDYPISEHQHNDIQLQLTTVYNAVCADRIVFNSEYNRQTFLSGAKSLLKKMPDLVPKQVTQSIEHRSQVLPVPVNETPKAPIKITAGETLHILWNHRWEYDKNPETFFSAMEYLKNAKVDFTLDIIGQNFRSAPKVFEQAFNTLSDRIRTWGFLPEDEYQACLQRCNLVISTSWHDFQGLALQEAIANGCLPVAPARVAYPEYLPEDLLYPVDGKNETQELADKLIAIQNSGYCLMENPVNSYSWKRLQGHYSQLIEQLLALKVN